MPIYISIKQELNLILARRVILRHCCCSSCQTSTLTSLNMYTVSIIDMTRPVLVQAPQE
jgi:hypothetical protein